MSRFVTCCAIVVLAAQSGYAATVTFNYSRRAPTIEEQQSEPTLSAMAVHEFFVTSDADILSVNNVEISGTLYQDPLGTDTGAPIPPFTELIPSLGADSWITTPGNTSTAGGGFSNPRSSWFDSSNDGAVTHFMFARLTSPNLRSFSGRVSVAGATSVENFEFAAPIVPEPASMAMAGMGLIGMIAASRSRKWLND